jgi:hypothetical protein
MDIKDYIIPIVIATLTTTLVFIEHKYVSRQDEDIIWKEYLKLFFFTFVSVLGSLVVVPKVMNVGNMVKIPNVFTGEPNF